MEWWRREKFLTAATVWQNKHHPDQTHPSSWEGSRSCPWWSPMQSQRRRSWWLLKTKERPLTSSSILHVWYSNAYAIQTHFEQPRHENDLYRKYHIPLNIKSIIMAEGGFWKFLHLLRRDNFSIELAGAQRVAQQPRHFLPTSVTPTDSRLLFNENMDIQFFWRSLPFQHLNRQITILQTGMKRYWDVMG